MTARTYRVHQPVAEAAMAAPGTWHLVSTYNSRANAANATSRIESGRLAAYQPAGTFETDTQLTPDGGRQVWVRYVGAPEATPLEQARSIAVRLEQEIARLHQVVAFLLTNPLQRMDMRVFTSDIDAMAGRVTITDLGNDRTEITYRWLADVLAEPADTELPL